jgi:hypothetical protein
MNVQPASHPSSAFQKEGKKIVGLTVVLMSSFTSQLDIEKNKKNNNNNKKKKKTHKKRRKKIELNVEVNVAPDSHPSSTLQK